MGIDRATRMAILGHLDDATHDEYGAVDLAEMAAALAGAARRLALGAT
jgi:hypothetical protein